MPKSARRCRFHQLNFVQALSLFATMCGLSRRPGHSRAFYRVHLQCGSFQRPEIARTTGRRSRSRN
jgi:hypothetical protein